LGGISVHPTSLDLSHLLQNCLSSFDSIKGDFHECYAISIHKAGSTLTHTIIGQVCNLANVPGISIPDILFKEDLFEKNGGNK
jgi:hypothetical protein